MSTKEGFHCKILCAKQVNQQLPEVTTVEPISSGHYPESLIITDYCKGITESFNARPATVEPIFSGHYPESLIITDYCKGITESLVDTNGT